MKAKPFESPYYATLRHNLEALQGGRTDEEMAYKIRAKCPKTWVARKKDPSTLSMEEFLRLCATSEKCKKNPGLMLTEELI